MFAILKKVLIHATSYVEVSNIHRNSSQSHASSIVLHESNNSFQMDAMVTRDELCAHMGNVTSQRGYPLQPCLLCLEVFVSVSRECGKE